MVPSVEMQMGVWNRKHCAKTENLKYDKCVSNSALQILNNYDPLLVPAWIPKFYNRDRTGQWVQNFII